HRKPGGPRAGRPPRRDPRCARPVRGRSFRRSPLYGRGRARTSFGVTAATAYVSAGARLGPVAFRALLVWAAMLGIQVGQNLIPNFRIAIADVLLAAVALLVLLDPALRRRAFAIPAPLRWALV